MAAVSGSQLSPLHENISERTANKNRLEHKNGSQSQSEKSPILT